MTDIKAWMAEKIAEEAGIKIEDVSYDSPIEEFRLDSLALLSFSFDLESKLGRDQIDPSVFTEFNTINKLALWLEKN